MDKRKPGLINIVGIDGSGKTTLALTLAETLKRTDNTIQYRYCQYFAKLLYPMKMLARISVMRRTDQYRDYESYNHRKKATSRKYPILAGLYSLIWLTDYLLQVTFKITLPLLAGRRLIIDRYIFDIAVNLSLTTGSDQAYALALIRRFFRFGKRPDLVLFIDLPEEIAFQRKNDIPAIEYLKERRERYVFLAEKFGFKRIDGTLPLEKTVEQALAFVADWNKDVQRIEKPTETTDSPIPSLMPFKRLP
jgi:dTMP kinase